MSRERDDGDDRNGRSVHNKYTNLGEEAELKVEDRRLILFIFNLFK